MHTTEEKAILSLTKKLAASRERVFRAWTDPDEIPRWFGPERCPVIDAVVDLRVGGVFRFHFVSSEQEEYWLRGEFREITPPARLVYTWQWENDPDYAERETLVTVEFVVDGDSTQIRLTHENLPGVESAGRHEHGWKGSFERLEKLF